jgi:hypothetical protein
MKPDPNERLDTVEQSTPRREPFFATGGIVILLTVITTILIDIALGRVISPPIHATINWAASLLFPGQ